MTQGVGSSVASAVGTASGISNAQAVAKSWKAITTESFVFGGVLTIVSIPLLICELLRAVGQNVIAAAVVVIVFVGLKRLQLWMLVANLICHHILKWIHLEIS